MKKVVLISGGSDGLGRRVAEELAPEHAVVILSPDEKKLARVAKEVGCEYAACDISDEKAVASAVAQVQEKHGRIDCLINNAGIWIQGPLEENDAARLRAVMDVNATGTMLLTRAVLPVMKKQKRGTIINVISQAGLYSKAERTVYTASKWALAGFTKSLEKETAPHGVRVMGLYPGMMKTELFAKAGDEKDFSDALDVGVVAKTVAFMLAAGDDVVFPEVGIKHIRN